MTCIEASRKDWSASSFPTTDQIQLGAILRIAASVEKMAVNHSNLIDDRDRYKRWYEDELRQKQSAERRINALRGVITRMKRKAAAK